MRQDGPIQTTERTIGDYKYTTKKGETHVTADVNKVITEVERTWAEMAEAVLPATILQELKKRHKRQSKWMECERCSHGDLTVTNYTRFSGLRGMEFRRSMHHYNFYHIPDFSICFDREIPSGGVLPHGFRIYGFLGGNERGGYEVSDPTGSCEAIHGRTITNLYKRRTPRNASILLDPFVKKVRDRFEGLVIRNTVGVDSGVKFKGDGRGTTPFWSMITIDFHDNDSTDTVKVTFFPDHVGKPDFCRAEVRCKRVSFARWEKFFPFRLDQQRLRDDLAYQQQVYLRLQHIIVLGEDPGPKAAKRIASTLEKSTER